MLGSAGITPGGRLGFQSRFRCMNEKQGNERIRASVYFRETCVRFWETKTPPFPSSARKLFSNGLESLRSLDAEQPTSRIDPEISPSNAIAKRVVRRRHGPAANLDSFWPHNHQRDRGPVRATGLDELKATTALRQGREIHLVNDLVLEDQGFPGRDRVLGHRLVAAGVRGEYGKSGSLRLGVHEEGSCAVLDHRQVVSGRRAHRVRDQFGRYPLSAGGHLALRPD